jgi:DNA-binding NarL/FixJ family response regulator
MTQRQQPTEPAFMKSEQPELPLGLVWVKCASPILSLGLEEVLKAHAAHVHRGQKPPAGDSASLAVLFCSRAEDVAWELKHLQALAPNTPSVLFSFSVDPQQARSALRAGARGFIDAQMTPEQIVRTLSVASEGDVVLPRELLNHFVKEQSQQQGDLPGLTSRQWEILKLVAEGESKCPNSPPTPPFGEHDKAAPKTCLQDPWDQQQDPSSAAIAAKQLGQDKHRLDATAA